MAICGHVVAGGVEFDTTANGKALPTSFGICQSPSSSSAKSIDVLNENRDDVPQLMLLGGFERVREADRTLRL